MADQSDEWADERWVVVGGHISLRIAELHLTKAEVIRTLGVSDKTLAGYMAGQPIRRLDKRRDLALALGWTADSIERILRGEEPEIDDEAIIEIVGRRSGSRRPAASAGGVIDISDLDDEDRAQIEALVERLRRSAD